MSIAFILPEANIEQNVLNILRMQRRYGADIEYKSCLIDHVLNDYAIWVCS